MISLRPPFKFNLYTKFAVIEDPLRKLAFSTPETVAQNSDDNAAALSNQPDEASELRNHGFVRFRDWSAASKAECVVPVVRLPARAANIIRSDFLLKGGGNGGTGGLFRRVFAVS